MKVVEELAAWDGCDAIIHLGVVGRHFMVSNMMQAVLKTDPGFPRSIYEKGSRDLLEGEKILFNIDPAHGKLWKSDPGSHAPE